MNRSEAPLSVEEQGFAKADVLPPLSYVGVSTIFRVVATKRKQPASDSSIPDAGVRVYQLKLRQLASKLSQAEARERRQIASDLHDHIGQALAYVNTKIARLQGNAMFCGFEVDLAEITAILEQAIRYTRDLTVEISPPVLYELGLAAALDWLAEQTSRRHGLKVTTSQSGEHTPVPEDIQVFVFKAVQELITNAVKHAEADQIAIKVEWKPTRLDIAVRDNGRGFDTSALDRQLSEGNCFGLFSVRERLLCFGGLLQVVSQPKRGTTATITVPLSGQGC